MSMNIQIFPKIHMYYLGEFVFISFSVSGLLHCDVLPGAVSHKSRQETQFFHQFL